MKKLPKNLEQRRHIQKRYNEELSELTASTSKHPEGFFTPPEHSDTVQYYCARFPKNLRDDIINYLADKNIHTSVHFKPLHKYEILKRRRKYPVADDEWLKLISLPCHNRMTEEDIDYVIYWVKEYFYRHAIGIWG
jgi:perosamine synthetase